MGDICDTGDRIVVTNARPVGTPTVATHGATTALAGSVVVISRADGTRTTGAIARGSVLRDDCGGSAGSHAGCSDASGSTIRSTALGADVLFLDPAGHASTLTHAGVATACRDATARRLAWCATRRWFAVVEVAVGGQPVLRVYRGATTGTSHDAGPVVERPAVREHTGFTAGPVRITIGDGTGSLELDGEHEACLALRTDQG